MTLEQSILAFTLTAALLTITPGLDTALVLRSVASEGPKAGLLAGAGICIGCLAWGLIVSMGLGALIAVSEAAYAILKWAGACYLVWLGLTLIVSSRRDLASKARELAQGSGAIHFRRGLLTNILNPKVGVFYVSFLPQFMPPEANVPLLTMLLTGIHALLGLIWFALLVAASQPIGRAFESRAVVKWLDRLTGGLFVAFGLRLALEMRR